jgi:protein-tyrosine-phosphatase
MSPPHARPDEPPALRQQITRIIDALAHDYEDRFDRAAVDAVYRDSYARLTEHASVRTYLPVLAQRFAVQRLDLRARTEGKRAHRAPTVLFVCVRNAGRSQMAAALLRHYAGNAVHIHTAGSAPAESIHPEVAQAMKDVGLSLDAEFPKPLTTDVVAAADVVVLLGCGDECPVVPGRRYEDWPVADPAGATAEQVAAIRADVDRRVRELIQGLLPDLSLPAPVTPAA